MRQGNLAAATVVLALALVSGALLPASGQPPRPGTDDNGLTENESATLWSLDDDRFVTNEEYATAYGESRSVVHEVANGTDFTFTRPPTTAARWTRADHGDFVPGGAETSVYPPHANRTNGTFVRDAHATVFAVSPATVTHLAPNDTRHYVAPNGTLRGIVDYRVVTPPARTSDNRTVKYSIVDHEIESVRLERDGTVGSRSEGSHRPTLPYELNDPHVTLRLAADVHVEVEKTVTVANHSQRSANATTGDESTVETRTTTVKETVTATDTVTVRRYDLQPSLDVASYANGDSGVAVFTSRPWQRMELAPDGSHRVRGVWRFFTARDPRWDTLRRSSKNGTDTVDSPALPVAVHAYPSTLGPRVDPAGPEIELVRVWGADRPSPAPALPANLTVDVATGTYTPSYGVAVQTTTEVPETVTVGGIVRGVNATLDRPDEQRRVDESDLDLRVGSRSADGAFLVVELTDAETGEPIVLEPTADPRYQPIVDGRDGYVTVAGERVRTNASGLATVTVTEAGVYAAEYHPGSWLTHDPAYTSDTATVGWHPLSTVAGWIDLSTTALTIALTFGLVVYAGRRLGQLLLEGVHR